MRIRDWQGIDPDAPMVERIPRQRNNRDDEGEDN